MDLFADPTVWLGLLTLVILEIVLGIDNLVFIAILADKLPEHQRDKARLIGLSLALVMRLGLLASISWLITLTEPLFSVWGHEFSGRDLILLLGGLFLLFKATMELHERLEGGAHRASGPRPHAAFGIVIAQIVALDAVFSLDSVITAVGMVDELWVMMTAVIIAIGVMMLASKPLTRFVSQHPTLIVLCLGFLLMIGFSLVAEGFEFHIPKGYLYAAIGFSVLIEVFNQVARANRVRVAKARPLRERTADAVLRLLGGPVQMDRETPLMNITEGAERVFAPVERRMIRRVLDLSQHTVASVMTPRRDIEWIDLDADDSEIVATLQRVPHTRLLVARGDLDSVEGLVHSRDLLRAVLGGSRLDVRGALVRPLTVHERMSVLRVLEQMRKHPVPLAIVVDEYGSVEGIVTVTDILAAIAGELPDTADADDEPVRVSDESWLLPGTLPLTRVARLLDIEEPDTREYHTVAGLALSEFGHIPARGERFDWAGWTFEVQQVEGRRLERILVYPAREPEVS